MTRESMIQRATYYITLGQATGDPVEPDWPWPDGWVEEQEREAKRESRRSRFTDEEVRQAEALLAKYSAIREE